MVIKSLSKSNKYLKVPLFLSVGGGGVQTYDYLLLPKTAYIDTNVVDTSVNKFSFEYIPISLQNSYQNYLSSKLDNFTYAYYTGTTDYGWNYLRIQGLQITRDDYFTWNSQHRYDYDNGNNSLGNSGENIIINNNTNLNRGGYQKFIKLELSGNNNYIFVPAAIDGDVGIYEMNNQIFIAASGLGAEVGNF